MPMTWNAEANAKLLLGIMEQLKEMDVKLNYPKLAAYMGPECSNRAIDHQLLKLKKMASGDSKGQSTPGTPGTPAKSTTPAGTPRKRRAPAGVKSTPSKKKKTEEAGDENEGEMEERLVKEVRDELKDL
ncbi:hypothetical protein BJX76DRAFT_358815 [Aspergillus varians]